MSPSAKGLMLAASIMPTLLAAGNERSVRPPNQGERSASAQNRARYVKLRPAPDTDVVLPEMALTFDGNRTTRVTLERSLASNSQTRLFWVVDPSNSTYRVFELSGNSKADARRLAAFYRDKHVSIISEDRLASHLETERLAQQSEFDLHRRGRMRLEQNRDLDMPLPSPEEDGPEADESREEGDEPVSSEPSSSEQASSCDGNAFSKIETWEPARYIFDVDHLNETWTAA